MHKISKLLISDEQEKIRTQWRVAVVSISLIFSILALIIMLFNAHIVLIAAILLNAILIQFACIWFCAYRKPGTKLLSYMLFIQPINLLLLIVISLESYGTWIVLIWMFTIPLAWFYVASWKLRAVNKAIRESNFL
ncbi:MAG: hypothetical protein WA347_03075 [Rhabdochlamydiaceae bacterium]|jgi:hypothetical protein